jgi:hypothetical protein
MEVEFPIISREHEFSPGKPTDGLQGAPAVGCRSPPKAIGSNPQIENAISAEVSIRCTDKRLRKNSGTAREATRNANRQQEIDISAEASKLARSVIECEMD